MNGDLSTSCNLSNCDCDKPKPMTDQRARAAQRYMLCANLGTTAQVGLNMTTLPSGTVVVLYEDHIAALADERRLVWEEAYEYVKQHHFNVVTSKHATKTCVVLEDYFRAKAHAGQEG